MKTIRDTKLFNELMRVCLDDNQGWYAVWEKYCDETNCEGARLFGGLDRIDYTKKGVYFFDIVLNDNNGSFVVRAEL